MDRRAFITMVGGSILAGPLAVAAQRTEKAWRVGALSGQPPESSMWAPFRQQLRELGYVEGQNIVIEWKSSSGRAERFPDLAAELVRLKTDVIVAGDNPAIAAAQKATKTTPIVMVLAMDPVATGFVDSLAKPGGNITGLNTLGPEMSRKTLQLLKEAAPTVSRVAVLWDSTEPGRREMAKESEDAARALGLQVQLLAARSSVDLDRLFATMKRERLEAVLVHASQMISAHRQRIAELVTQNRLPSMSGARWFAEAGGLMSYGLSYDAQFRRAAHYVDKILKGARPADLPVEQPTRFEFVINLKTAKALGLTIPPSVLGRADHLIE